MEIHLPRQAFLVMRKMHDYGGGFVGKTLFLEDLARENSGTDGCGVHQLGKSLTILLETKFIELYPCGSGPVKGCKLTKKGFEAVEMCKKWGNENE